MRININVWKRSGNYLPVKRVIDGPILWCREGEFRLIPLKVIENAVNILESPSSFKRTAPKIYFTWDQGIPISNQAGRALVGE